MRDMRVEDFDYILPEELIAQRPTEDRDGCRLMVLNRNKGTVGHFMFPDIIDYLNEGDCLVLNDSRVIPARMYGVRESTGAAIEFLLSRRIEGDTWETLVRPGKKVKPGDRIVFGEGSLVAEVIDRGEGGTRIVRFDYDGIFMERLWEIGNMPLPPYIRREAGELDREMYQTVYSREDGSVAAPTAGLHFTEDLLKKIRDKGVRTAFVTLHVGIGTFRPVKAENVEDHHMHFEEYSIDKDNADIINDTIRRGGRIVACGTTSVRTLESAATLDDEGRYFVREGEDDTDIFIYPGYDFKVVDALITNFHLPKSTLLMLISALYNRDDILGAYEEAVRERYRFFSYGDAMLIE